MMGNGNGRSRRNGAKGTGHERVLITGGAGFIGTNLADRIVGEGRKVVILDNLSRAGVEQNLEWLLQRHGSRIEVITGDVRDMDTVRRAVTGVSQVFHFAAQVAVTTSIIDPQHDFEVNARGTLNLLLALREMPNPASVVYTSTNKVYGALDDVGLEIADGRYQPLDARIRARGLDESRPLDFHSPYGCSKGTADQYVIDFARTLGIPGVVFRMSCIYGPHQFGTEDQGWVAHFLIRALAGDPLTIYGDGRQVRDVLFVEDLVDAFLLAQQHMPKIAGEAFNIGGGPQCTTSLLELMERIEQVTGARPSYTHAESRPGDQRYYVSDPSKFQAATGWWPKVGLDAGLGALHDWLTGSSATLPRRVASRRTSWVARRPEAAPVVTVTGDA